MQDFHELVCRVYSFHDPEKIPDVDKILTNGGDTNPRAPDKIQMDLRSTYHLICQSYYDL